MNYELNSSLPFCADDDGCDDCDKFLRLLHQRLELGHLDDSRRPQEMEPIAALTSFLLRNAQFTIAVLSPGLPPSRECWARGPPSLVWRHLIPDYSPQGSFP